MEDREHSQLIESMDSKMIVTKGANKITILMGLTIMQARISRAIGCSGFSEDRMVF